MPIEELLFWPHPMGSNLPFSGQHSAVLESFDRVIPPPSNSIGLTWSRIQEGWAKLGFISAVGCWLARNMFRFEQYDGSTLVLKNGAHILKIWWYITPLKPNHVSYLNSFCCKGTHFLRLQTIYQFSYCVDRPNKTVHHFFSECHCSIWCTL